MAEDTASAREQVLAARAEFGASLTVLEASARAAIDIPARVRRSPAKAAALIGGVGFLALKGPQRVFGRAREAVTGKPASMPRSMLPDEVEKTLRKLGKDGDKVRGTLERDFADYAKKAHKDRDGVKTALLLAAVRPLLTRGAKAAGDALLTPDGPAFRARLEQVRERMDEARATVTSRDADRPDAATAPPDR